jgi:hypothetical protein
VLKYLKANARCLQSAFQFLTLILAAKVACWSMIGSNDHARYRAEGQNAGNYHSTRSAFFGLWIGIGSNHPHKPIILVDQ